MLLPGPRPLSQRYECKYVVPESVAARIAADLEPFVEPDPHARGKPGHAYPICSLYLDDPRLGLYRETIEGKRNRYKLRVRAYSDELHVPVFCEVKRRFDRVVSKLRCPIPRPCLRAVLCGDVSPPGLAAARPQALAEFVRLVQSGGAQPRVLVRYERQAYVGIDDAEVRVTFDRRLRICQTDSPELPMDGKGFVAVPVRGVILELKYTDRHPQWLVEIVRRHDLHRGSFSKYCRGIETGEIADTIATS
jgi:hypothetical protein